MYPENRKSWFWDLVAKILKTPMRTEAEEVLEARRQKMAAAQLNGNVHRAVKRALQEQPGCPISSN
jgi:hypothetical protein